MPVLNSIALQAEILNSQDSIWCSWWFRIAGFLFLLLLTFIYIRTKIKSVDKHHKEQEEFARQLIETEEMERQRIAHELHDSLGQNLLVIQNMLLTKIQQNQVQGSSLTGISELVSQTIQEVRTISQNLRPHILDQLGLTKAVKTLIQQLNDTSNIKIASKIDDIDKVLEPKAEINFYRLIQEGFNNVIKHSCATEAEIIIKNNSGIIELVLNDNGKGIINYKNSMELNQNFGLYGMQKRAHVFNWIYEINSKPGSGTSIRLSIPQKGKLHE